MTDEEHTENPHSYADVARAVYRLKAEETNRLANENRQLTEWVYLLEAFIKTTNEHVMPQSKIGQLKARLLTKRPPFLK